MKTVCQTCMHHCALSPGQMGICRARKNVLVTNGTADLSVLEELLPYIDAMNIDLKGFRQKYYEKLGGSLETVKEFIIYYSILCLIFYTVCLI